MTKPLEKLPEADQRVIDEALHWVKENGGKHAECGKGCSKYTSPRVSSELPDCSLPMTFDQYSYCSLGCNYCFAYFFKTNNPAIDKENVQLKAVNPEQLLKDIDGKATTSNGRVFYEHFYSKKFILHWGGLADPFCSFEQTNRVGYKILEGLGERAYPCLMSFKGATIFNKDYVRLFEKYAKQKNFAFQVSIITSDDELGKRIEIGVPPPSKRLEALKMLSDMGYWTVLRLRPYIIGITDQHIDDLLEKALAAGIKGISMEFFAMDGRSNVGMKTRYEWIGKLVGTGPELTKYFRKLSPSNRGGYMRLNRLVKESHVRRVYEFCQKHGLVCGISDPDFKEFNTSGSCCALPDKYKGNSDFANGWTRSQLTYHIKEARIKYHTTGKPQYLYFSQVYGDESYLDDRRLANDHVRVIGMCCADRVALTQRILLQETWNNLNSPANPRNYFDGKLLPMGLDSDGNYIFRYNPSEFEARWKAEGVKMV